MVVCSHQGPHSTPALQTQLTIQQADEKEGGGWKHQSMPMIASFEGTWLLLPACPWELLAVFQGFFQPKIRMAP